MEYVWVVTYQDGSEEPVVTVFSDKNKDEAVKAYNYFSENHDFCIIDHCKVYDKFNPEELKNANNSNNKQS